MKGLLGFLESADPEVVLISLQALQFLSGHPMNKEGLAKYPGLLGTLALLSDHDHEKVAEVSSSVMSNLADFVNGSSGAAARREERKEPAFKPKYLFNITLQLPQMQTKASADKVEAALLAVKGVISVTVDLGVGTATVYTRVKEEVIRPNMVVAVRRVGMVPSGEDGTVPKVTATTPARKPVAPVQSENAGGAANRKPAYPSFGGNGGKAAAPAGGGKPSYLTPSAKRAYKKGALVEYSSLQQSTLQARMQKQQQKKKEEQKKQSTVRSLFGSVTGYFW